MSNLIIKDLDVSVAEKPILNGVNLSINSGELHILMGPNGSGKSTLANTIFGNPKYSVNSGSLNLDGEEILKLKTDERAKKGLFLAFQEPVEISGVNIMNFLMKETCSSEHQTLLLTYALAPKVKQQR